MRIAAIMPAYNEASVIGQVIDSLPRRYKDKMIDVIVVDDASSDETERVALKHHAIVLRHLINGNSGASTRTGLEYALKQNYNYAVTIDADGQHSKKDFLKVLDELVQGKADIVIGSRVYDSKDMPWYRIIGNHGLNVFTWALLGARAGDSQSGLKGFSRKALEKIDIRTSGKEFCSEIIWRARQNKLIVHEVPIKAIYSDYSLAKGQSNWNALIIVKNLIKRRVLDFFHD